MLVAPDITCYLLHIIPMVMLDEREIGNGRPGELSLKLIDAFRKLVRSEGTAF